MGSRNFANLPADDLRKIADLKHDRGYVLLCDFVQAHLDNMMDQMSSFKLADEESLRLLRHWRALRAIHEILVTQPDVFYAQSEVQDQ